LENTSVPNPVINVPISIQEVKIVLKKAKLNKAVGLDNLPYEVMKNEESSALLQAMFDKVFSSGVIPSVWHKTILKPIPKNSTVDPRIPLKYRGIALLSTVYKLYSGILNNRLTKHLENSKLIHEEQNGFRHSRSCSEHVFVLNSIIRNRLIENKPTFAAFLDAEKAFDRIDRQLLLHKLLKHGINGNLYNNIKSIYKETSCCIKVNDMLTEWFATNCGVLQGDTLSPTLFNIFVNDLISDVNSQNKGIHINDTSISMLLYADDIVLLSNSAEDLQCLLNTVYDWSFRNMIKFNCEKSNIIHFRRKQSALCTHTFTIGSDVLKL